MNHKRGCGILLHPSSLPGLEPIGTLGKAAFEFIDTLHSIGVSCWQTLPLNPPSCCNSPYSAFSAFAGNPLLIDLETIVLEGDLQKQNFPESTTDKVDFDLCHSYKEIALHSAAASFFERGDSLRMESFWHFCDTTPWLHDYALFMALNKKYKGKPWWNWSKSNALVTKGEYEKLSVECGVEIGTQKYIQWQFFRQWGSIKEYANSHGIELIGDIPIFVALNSADVWCNRSLFLLDETGKPSVVAGVPPDYFSKTGQLWGNPLYDWRVHEESRFYWWRERFRWMFKQFDTVRIDHFRGFESAWHVPANHKTAAKGRWVAGPGEVLFDSIQSDLGKLSLIAEDLGFITPEVERLRDRYNFPGMKILQFAFGSDSDNPYLPHNHCRRSVLYTGTHDNNTTAGWYAELPVEEKKSLHDYLGDISGDPVKGILRTAFMSVADLTVVPLQDLLELGSEARMNIPGKAYGNWDWRFQKNAITESYQAVFRELLKRYGRYSRNDYL